MSRVSHDDWEEMDIGSRLVAVVNVTSTDLEGDGLFFGPEDSLFEIPDGDPTISALSLRERGTIITKEILAKRWGIGLDTAHRTLESTTQKGVRRVLHPVEHCYRTRQSHLRFPMLKTRFYTDTMFSTMKSIRGNKCAQVFTNGIGYDLFYPLKKEADAADALNNVTRSVGIPMELVSDGAKAETQGRFGGVIKEFHIKQRTTEAYSAWQNRAEASVRELKRGIMRATRRARSPKRLWDYCGEWVAAIRWLTAHDLPGLGDRVPTEMVDGHTPDISVYVQFDWYQYIWYYDPSVQFPDDAKQLGRWLGVAHDVGNPMCFWVLPPSCKVVARSTVQALLPDEMADPEVQAKIAQLDAAIREKIGDTIPDNEVNPDLRDLLPHIPEDLFLEEPEEDQEAYEPDAEMSEADKYT